MGRKSAGGTGIGAGVGVCTGVGVGVGAIVGTGAVAVGSAARAVGDGGVVDSAMGTGVAVGAGDVGAAGVGAAPSHDARTSAAASTAASSDNLRRLGCGGVESIMRSMSMALRGPAWGRGFGRRAAVRLLPVLTLLLVLAACSGGEEPTSTPSSTPTAVPSPGEIIAASIDAMTQVTSFRFLLENEGGETPISNGLGLRRAEGAMVTPDRLEAEIDAVFAGLVLRLEVVGAGGKTYMTNPISGEWQVFDTDLNPLAFFDPAEGVPRVLRGMEDLLLGELAEVDGRAAYAISGRVPAEAAQFMAGSFAEGSILDADLLIDAETYELLEAVLDGRLTADEPEGVSRTLRFSDFGAAFEIEPPI